MAYIPRLRTWPASGTMLVAGVLALSACGSDDPDPASGEPASGEENASVKEEVVVALSGDIDNFDPHTNQLIIYEYAVRELVFSSLVKYDAQLNIQPDLAEYEVNEDATKFVFHLDPDGVFHDGEPVDAEAVIASLERAAGAEDSIWAPRLADVAGYDAPDEHTVVITLNSPDAAFLAGLTDIAIIAPSNFEDVGSDPVGSGPYEFVSWEANTQIELERFDGYFGEQAPTKRLIEKPMADQQVALNNLYSGSVDIIASASAATVSQVDGSRADVVEPESSNSLSLIEFNSSGKLGDPQVRRALAHALDKESIKEIVYDDGGTNIWSPLPESSWAHVSQEGYPYDLQKAEDLLADAGASGLEFTLEMPSDFPEAEQIARVWQSSLAEIGVTLNPNSTELSVWLDAYVSRDYDATWNVFNVGGDPHSFFDVIMKPHLGDDYPNATVEQLVADATAVADQGQRADLYAEAQEILVDELPVMIVQSTPLASIVAPGVTGYEVNPRGWALLDQVAVTE